MASSSSRSSRDRLMSMVNIVRDVTAKRQRGNTPTSELGRYSATDYAQTMGSGEDFQTIDILAWWSRKESEFPILSTVASDLLIVQASTVASESAFSLSAEYYR